MRHSAKRIAKKTSGSNEISNVERDLKNRPKEKEHKAPGEDDAPATHFQLTCAGGKRKGCAKELGSMKRSVFT